MPIIHRPIVPTIPNHLILHVRCRPGCNGCPRHEPEQRVSPQRVALRWPVVDLRGQTAGCMTFPGCRQNCAPRCTSSGGGGVATEFSGMHPVEFTAPAVAPFMPNESSLAPPAPLRRAPLGGTGCVERADPTSFPANSISPIGVVSCLPTVGGKSRLGVTRIDVPTLAVEAYADGGGAARKDEVNEELDGRGGRQCSFRGPLGPPRPLWASGFSRGLSHWSRLPYFHLRRLVLMSFFCRLSPPKPP